MKKIYTLALCLAVALGFSQSIIITRVVDGTLPGDGCTGIDGESSPKFVELYVDGTLDLTNYRFQTEVNGVLLLGPIHWNGGADLGAIGTVTDSFIYIVGAGAATFSQMYPAITIPTGLGIGLPYGDGNEAYRIAITNSIGLVLNVVDQYGIPTDITGPDDFSAVWTYHASYAKRHNDVTANGGFFDPTTFTYGGNNALSPPNNNCGNLIAVLDIGNFTLGIGEQSISGLNVFPNPVTNGNLYITSESNDVHSVLIYDLLGKPVMKANVKNRLDVSNLKAGLYIVNITAAGKSVTKKLVIE
jgi:hypothetical protein